MRKEKGFERSHDGVASTATITASLPPTLSVAARCIDAYKARRRRGTDEAAMAHLRGEGGAGDVQAFGARGHTPGDGGSGCGRHQYTMRVALASGSSSTLRFTSRRFSSLSTKRSASAMV